MINRFISIFIFCVIFSSSLDAKLTKVTLGLDWKYQFEYAGYIIAKEKGYYKDAGLDVNISEVDFAKFSTDKLYDDEVDFAIADGTIILQNLNYSKDYIMMFALAQASPNILIALKSSGIKTLKDFKGKKMHFANKTNGLPAEILSMLNSNNIDISKDIIPYYNPKYTLDILTKHKADIMQGYSTITPFYLKKLGYDYIYFSPKDYGFSSYGVVLYTTKRVIQKDPQMVKAFYEASLKGWKYAFAHIDEAIEIIKSKYDTQHLSKELLKFEANEYKKLAFLNGGGNLGNINPIKLDKIITSYKLLGKTNSKKSDFSDYIYNPNPTKNSIFSTSQLKYIQDNPIITVGVTKNNKPISFIDKNGLHSGIDEDILRFISQKSGFRFIYNDYNSKEELKQALKTHKIDFYISKDIDKSFLTSKDIFHIQTPNKNISLKITTNKDNKKLQDILVKSIKELSPEQKEFIHNKWFPKVVTKFDWTIIWQILSLASIIIIFLLYKNIKQKSTEQDRLNALVKSKTKELENLLSNFKVFTANSIHQTRVPLTVIGIYNDMIKDSEIHNNIKASLVTMDHIYDNLAYKVRKDYLEFKKEQINFSQTLKDRLKLFDVVVTSNDKEVISDIEDNIMIDFNKTELEYIIDNNLSNSIKYGYHQKPIFVKLKKEDKIILKFCNEGKEIQNKNKIFDRYTRETKQKQGQGIGLHMVKEICDKNHIEIDVYFQDGKNCFEYRFIAF